ncbi:hypothetical protein BPOR_0898g00050 [Botrytis porri]|uniref:Uncharacterized protein n=1 Tax=Botrytis porri TaxID=87229 RepID=A0A4Z1K7V8_9HELO|nr:hypothetical protein BPOR_0898g00050 [Botrytis porri]
MVHKQKIWRYMSIVYYPTISLEQKISSETLLENSRCRFCADAPSCPLQSHNIISIKPPTNGYSEKMNEEEKNEMEASKKAVARDEKPLLFEAGWHDGQMPKSHEEGSEL